MPATNGQKDSGVPELPEVEHVARQLRAELPGRRIVSVTVLWPRTLGGMEPPEFAARVTGQTVRAIGRRGKHLVVELDGGDALVIHRRMSGNLLFLPPEERDPWARVVFGLDDGRALVFSDPRKFGRALLVRQDELGDVFAGLGPEPLEETFTAADLEARLRGSSRAIKAALLDQSVVAGLGNIYADEALFRAGVNPLRPAASLSAEEIARLHDAIRETLLLGIENGGTTFGRHRDVYDEAGTNLEYLNVYRRAGQACRVCGQPIERVVIAQRSAHYCPHCQPRMQSMNNSLKQ
jgi:formamidopyrimidine-DNA glycosylase